jgi:serine/threonine-protein kinase RsbT
MAIRKVEQQAIVIETDIVLVRQLVKRAAIAQGMRLLEQTKMITAASELARNALEYGGGGVATVEYLEEAHRKGVRAVFVDHGPGIPDIELALRDGYTSGHGMGLGLGGAKRLVQTFELSSVVGVGTTVAITRWT